jgi:hypothetical protein
MQRVHVLSRLRSMLDAIVRRNILRIQRYHIIRPCVQTRGFYVHQYVQRVQGVGACHSLVVQFTDQRIGNVIVGGSELAPVPRVVVEVHADL